MTRGQGLGDFISTKSEHDYIRAEREREAWEYDNFAEGEVSASPPSKCVSGSPRQRCVFSLIAPPSLFGVLCPAPTAHRPRRRLWK